MRVIKAIVFHLLFVVLLLMVVNYLAALFLTEPSLSRPRLLGPEARSEATWPLRRDPVTGWALAAPLDRSAEMRKGFVLSHTGIGVRWIPGTLDMGPPLVLLVMGDEVAFGPTVPLEDTFGGWIKRSMEERLPDRTVAVANAAVPGYDALQMYLQFRRLSSLRPHLALFCFSSGEGFGPEEPVRRPTDVRAATLKELFYRPALTSVLYLGLDRLTDGAEVAGIRWAVDPRRMRPSHPEAFGEALRGIIAHADRARIPLLMLNLGLPEPERTVLESTCVASGVAYVDGDMALVEHAEEALAHGSRGVAEGVGRALDRSNDQHEWWVLEHLRSKVRPVFLSRTYFTPQLLPTRLTYRTVGDELSMMIVEEDLFSWRRRVLR